MDEQAGSNQSATGPAALRPVLRRLFADFPWLARSVALVVLANVGSAVATVALAGWLGEGISQTVLSHRWSMPVWRWLTIGGGLAWLRGLGEWGRRVSGAAIARRLREALRLRIVDAVMERDPLAIPNPGEVLAAAGAGVDAVAELAGSYLPQLAYALSVPLVLLAGVWWWFWPAGLLLLVTTPLIPFFMALVGRATEAAGRRQFQLLSRLEGLFLDLVQGVGTLRRFGQVEAYARRVEAISERYRRTVFHTLRLAFLNAFVLELGAALLVAMVAVATGLALVHGRLGFGPALAVLILAPEYFLPLRQLGAGFHQAQSGIAAVESIFGLIEAPRANQGGTTGLVLDLRGRAPALALEGVRVAHPGRLEPVLDGLSLGVEPGATLLVTGPSGAGKSTLLGLWLGLGPRVAGRVLVDGVEVQALDRAWWHGRVGYLPQHPYLVIGTIRQNLLWGHPEASEHDLWEALALALADDWVAGLPQELDTPIGEGGANLSFGERQRLAVARLFLGEPSVLLLDEPGEHLDPTARRLLLEHLGRFAHGRTTVLVTHYPHEISWATHQLHLGGGGLGLASPAPGISSDWVRQVGQGG
ncbi:MAG: thiol reductant ABC exporter subunit CydD [Firmicutes bacterium]|nr:thiol reductant ABC exporter subunit CydD [Alicyclobacillaceae bacterium]MCL6498257.1 thiol reductant ABC exporter subunit CydD [Bacillota bacterium]